MIGAVVVPARDAGGQASAAARTAVSAAAGAAAQRMCEQLARAGTTRCVVIGDGSAADSLQQLAALLRSAGDDVTVAAADVVVAAADVVVHDEALADLVRDPRPRSAALVGQRGDGRGGRGVRVGAGRVVEAASAVHEVTDGPDSCFTGIVRIAGPQHAAAAACAAEMADAAGRHGWRADPLDLLLVALVRRGVPVAALPIDPWPWGREVDEVAGAALRDRFATLDAHEVRLRRAVKADDGFWSTFTVRKVSPRLTPVALRMRLTPNQVTLASFTIGLVAAACFAVGGRLAGVVGILGAVLLQLSLVVDCVDGEVARYSRTFSPLGAWLDASTDRVKEFACYAGLALGAGGSSRGWLLAAALLTLQTVRHTADYTFTAVDELRKSTVQRAPLDQRAVASTTPGHVGAARAVEASARGTARPSVRWAKKVAHLGIGERWFLISLGAAVARPAAALGVLLVLGVLSLGYATAGRALRTRAWPALPPMERERAIVAAQRDPGPVVLLATGRRSLGLPGLPGLPGPPGVPGPWGRWAWTLPAVVRLGEYAVVLTLTWTVAPQATAAAFVLLFVVAYHHYDDLYTVLGGLAPPGRRVRLLGLGADGRVLLVVALTLAGAVVLLVGLWVLAAVLGLLFVVYGSFRVSREALRRRS